MIYAQYISKLVTPGDPPAYVFQLVNVKELAKLAVITSDDALTTYDLNSFSFSKGRLNTASVYRNGIHNGVTCLGRTSDDPHLLFSAGRDGLVKQYDLRDHSPSVNLFEHGRS